MRHRISLVDAGEVFSCAEDQHLLAGMQTFRVGRKILEAIPVGCRGGGCGICRIRVLSGDYATRKMSCKHIPPEARASGLVLACRVFPRGDLRIEVVPLDAG